MSIILLHLVGFLPSDGTTFMLHSVYIVFHIASKVGSLKVQNSSNSPLNCEAN